MVKALAKMEQEKKQQGQKTNQKQPQKEKEDKTYKGKQSLDKLMKQNVQLSNIEITDGNIKSFERVASTAKAVKVAPVLGALHTLKPNRIEAELLSGVPIVDDRSLAACADALLATGLHRVFISLGGDPSSLAASKREFGRLSMYCFSINRQNTLAIPGKI